ncbi:MAG: MFS transporter, partial [Planctomycetota bacterium]|nr:MFS transporter [Planctomycetota bacterium]
MTEPPFASPSRLRRLAGFLGLRRSVLGLLVMVVLVGMGERLAERFLPIYLIALGSGMLWPGFLNALDNLLSALYSFPGGYLADRLGVKRALVVFNLLAMAGYCVVIFIPRWEAVVFGSFLFLSWSAISLPATMSLLADVLPREKRTMGVTLISLVRRIPMALGPVLGGVCIDTWGRVAGVRIAFGGALAMAVFALFAQQFMIKEEKKPDAAGAGKAEKNPLKLFREMSPALRNLLVSDILIRFC